MPDQVLYGRTMRDDYDTHPSSTDSSRSTLGIGGTAGLVLFLAAKEMRQDPGSFAEYPPLRTA